MSMRTSRNRWGCGCALAMLLFLIFWFSGAPFGIAAWLDSERIIAVKMQSPDGSLVAQIEHIVMGGAPLTVVTVRRWWEPNTSLNLCRLAVYYADVPLAVRWRGDQQVEIAASAAAHRHRIDARKCRQIGPVFSLSGQH